MQYEIILFDADGTLFNFEKSERTAFAQTMREFGIPYRESVHLKQYKEINAVLWQQLERGEIKQKELNMERFCRFLNKIHAEIDPLRCADSYTAHLSQASFLLDGAAELVRRLAPLCRMAVVTNGLTKVQNGRIRGSAIGAYFEKIVISEEVGVSKPDAEIFRIALNGMGVTDKSRVLMVGDSLASDIAGGARFGVDTCWYNPEHTENGSGLAPTCEISRLTDLLRVVLPE